MMKTHILRFWLACALLPVAAIGQSPAAPGFQEDLLDRLQGQWMATGTLNGKPITFVFQSEWVLNHQFFHICQKQQRDDGAPPFEAEFYIGHDAAQRPYVAHVLTIFGAADSPSGTGERNGNDLKLSFPRPKGEIVYHFEWRPESHSWRITAANNGATFNDLTAKRLGGEPAK